MKSLLTLLFIFTSSFSLLAQSQTQTIKGRIFDEASGAPLSDAIVVVADVTPIRGGTTDSLGFFKIDSVVIGRHTLKISLMPYEAKTLNDIEVTAGKQVNLNIGMQEGLRKLKEVSIVYNRSKDKNATNNDMAMVSARSFNVDETKKYAGALGDPSRMAANFAGVVAGDDSRNDIVVRGNSPNGMLWQLDGLNIPNPNHFGALNSTGGPVSMLNNNNIDKSDFLTGAFPAQYGNAVAGVFDIRLREGNRDKQEYVGQVGFNGFEGGVEGPIGKNKQTSYLINYRYTTLGIFKALGINLGTGTAVPIYQDVNYKLVSRLSKKSKLTFFGIAGNSKVDFLGKDVDTTKPDLYTDGDPFENTSTKYSTIITGASYDYQISANSSTRLTAGYSATSEAYQVDSVSNDYSSIFHKQTAVFKTGKASVLWTYLHKFNARNNIQTGVIYDHTSFSINNKLTPYNNPEIVYVDQKDGLSLVQTYAQWKHRFSNKLVMVSGLHLIYLDLNSSFAIEPRVNLRYTVNSRHAFSLGYGMHNQMQSIYTYFVQTHTASGTELTNKNLGFTRSNHIIGAYDFNVNQHMRIKLEGYYQSLDNIPVTSFSSTYSAVNEGINFAPPDQDHLVNNGKGYNYGAELTVEHFLSKGYYFLVTGSLINSRYKGSDGIERNTTYNTGYVANMLGGKEFKIGHSGSIIAVNIKVALIGGKYLTPLDLAASALAHDAVYDESRAFSVKQSDYFRTDFKLSYRKEFKRSTMEFSVDLENVTNHKNIFDETYDARKNKKVVNYQQGFFPVPLFRWTF